MDMDVAIIGAGAAGIGAARRLKGSRLKVMMLEAAPRIGGRAWTLDIAGIPVDMGCAWLHSASRNVWTGLAEKAGVKIDRRESAWRTQYRDLGFTRVEQEAARQSFEDFTQRLIDTPPASDIAADALKPGDEWNNSIRTKVGYISGGVLEDMSAQDYAAYETAATDENWRLPGGYGTLITSHLPTETSLRLSTPVNAISLSGNGVTLETLSGTLRARAVILTVSTAILARGAIKLPASMQLWQEAAAQLPLGRDEKVLLEVVGNSPFEPETHVMGNPHDLLSASYNIRSMGLPLIECYLGNDSAAIVAEQGPAAAFAHVIDGLANLFGADVRRCLRPLITSSWTRTTHIQGSYSYARPGQASARQRLALPFEDRIFFAGEATSPLDYTTAHGAHDSGLRAAEETLTALAKLAA